MDANTSIQFKEGDNVWESVKCDLTISVHKQASSPVLDQLVLAYPTGASILEKHNQLPLHYFVDLLAQLILPVSWQ
jgi:hypothetical protein